MMALLAAGHGPTLQVEGFYVLDFILFVGAIVWFTRRPITDFLAARRDKMVKDIEEARRLREEAEARLAEYDTRLASLESEIEEILANARAEGEAERKRIMAGAARAAERLKHEAQARIEQETRKLKLELRRKMVDMSVAVAERIITEQITDTHRRRMVTEYIGDLETREEGL